MQTFIVLLRGINVGGHKKVPMAELRDLLSKNGFQEVRTYIQTGNIALKTSEKDRLTIEKIIHNAIASHFGFEVSVMAKTRSDIDRIFRNSPFTEEKKQKSYFAILHETPEANLVASTKEKTYEDEEYYIIDDAIYYYSAKGYGQAKFSLNYFERKLNTSATARNYRTMAKLLDFLSN